MGFVVLTGVTEMFYLPTYNAVNSDESQAKFWRYIPPPSPVSKKIQAKNQREAGEKLSNEDGGDICHRNVN